MKRKKATPKAKKEIKILIQTKISKDVFKKLVRLANSTSRSKAGYLRALVIAHVNAVDPNVAGALNRAWRDLEEKDVLKEGAP